MSKGIPKATHRETELLIAVVLGSNAIDITYGIVPGGAGIGLRRTPPVTGDANGDVCSKVEAVTARQT